mmetsp:Transcript_26039/g.39416  ORF Transcript_26039/g.39416 Transcript_26039/m.39416 type:complete len:482 (+) Transcript_26039:29-1474(+)
MSFVHEKCKLTMMATKRAISSASRVRRLSRMALGSHKYARVERGIYKLIVDEAIRQGITVLEAGQDNGISMMAEALLGYVDEPRLTVLQRLGYGLSDVAGKPSEGSIVVETGKTLNHQSQVVHSLSGASVEGLLQKSALMDLKEENIHIIPMVHNPEEHGDDTVSRLTDAFCALEEAVCRGDIPSFGVVSNGFSLPPKHPLHLDWKSTVLKAACDAAKEITGNKSNLSIVQLPANILETRGIQVARDLKSFLNANTISMLNLPKTLEIFAMRPLTCYPDQGTGDGDGFQLIDFPIPTEPGITEWTHEMISPPPVYEATMKRALSHFDATEILEAKQERKLSEHEEQTIEGAKILIEMIQGLDRRLESSITFSQHERELMSNVMPVLEGTFEEIDEQSLEILQDFFAAHGLAARYHIARRTRSCSIEGGKDVMPYKIPSNMKMQEFALGQLLKEQTISKIIVGATKPEHVRDTMQIFKQNRD